jgi:hypothetical protein
MPDHSQFNTDRTYPGRWTITFSNPPINKFVPTTIVELGALMTDLEADPSMKAVVFQSANPDFFRLIVAFLNSAATFDSLVSHRDSPRQQAGGRPRRNDCSSGSLASSSTVLMPESSSR